MIKLTTKSFEKWRTEELISEVSLIEAIESVENGLSHISLGAGLYKVRVARHGKGKSGGFRTILVFKENDRAIFVHGFAKSEQENLTKKELSLFKELSKTLLSLSEEQLKIATQNGAFKYLKGE